MEKESVGAMAGTAQQDDRELGRVPETLKTPDRCLAATQGGGHAEKVKAFWERFSFNKHFIFGGGTVVVLAACMALMLTAGRVLYFSEEYVVPGLSKIQLDYISRVQQNLERRIEEMLTPVIGAGRIIAKVNVDIDFSQKTIRRVRYDPKNSVVRSEQSSNETQKGKANLEAETSDDVILSGDGITGSVSTQDGTRETRITNYEINEEEQNIISNVGDIQRLTVGVIVDGAYTKNADGVMEFVPRPFEELQRIQRIIVNVVGFSETRGDSIEVTSMPIDKQQIRSRHRKKRVGNPRHERSEKSAPPQPGNTSRGGKWQKTFANCVGMEFALIPAGSFSVTDRDCKFS